MPNSAEQLRFPDLDRLNGLVETDILSLPGSRKRLAAEVTSLLTAPSDDFERYWDAHQRIFPTNRPIRKEAVRAIVAHGLAVLNDEALIELSRNYLSLSAVRDALLRESNLSDDWLHAYLETSEALASQAISKESGVDRHLFLAVTRVLKKAAVVLLSLGLLTSTVAAIHYRENALNYWDKWNQLFEQKKALPIPATPQQALKTALENAFNISVSAVPERRGLVQLSFSPLVRPPYVVAVSVDWRDGLNETGGSDQPDSQQVYLAGKISLLAGIQHDYSAILPTGGGDLVKHVVVTFDVTGAAMDIVGPRVVRIVTLRLTKDGVQLATPANSSGTHVGVESPINRQHVSDPFFVDFTVSSSNTSVLPTGQLHILIRPLDGPEDLANKYYVIPVSNSPEFLPGGEKHYHELVPLSSLVNFDPTQPNRPTRFQLLIVELPVIMNEWQLPIDQFDINSPQFAANVKVPPIQIEANTVTSK